VQKRDFPLARRGYDPAAVDAHLRAVAVEVDELQRAATGRGRDSLAAAAGTQVQSIIAAAEAAAAEIERKAQTSAHSARSHADHTAEEARTDALARAQVHVAAVGKATATLLARVESMDKALGVLLESLRAGATRLESDLAAVEANMGQLYDASSGADRAARDGEQPPAASPTAIPAKTAAPEARRSRPAPEPNAAPERSVTLPQPTPPGPAASTQTAEAATSANGDMDGARLIALNMALNGESRAEADRYLAENFQLADRQKLIDEVYAAIEN
jgi:DivIVA domain-containing protein